MVNTPQSEFYDAAPLEPHLLYQGEILIDLPLWYEPKPKRWLIARTGKDIPIMASLKAGQTPTWLKVYDSNQINEQLWSETHEGDYALGQLCKMPVLTLSQTCDIQQKDHIQVAPIFTAVGDEAHMSRLKQGEILSAFYLPPHPPEIPNENFADLEKIQAVHKSYIKRLAPDKHFRITDENRRRLQSFITRYFGRPNAFDVDSDRVPKTGVYLCVKCFYIYGEIAAKEFTEKGRFQPCDVCNGSSWILRGS